MRWLRCSTNREMASNTKHTTATDQVDVSSSVRSYSYWYSPPSAIFSPFTLSLHSNNLFEPKTAIYIYIYKWIYRERSLPWVIYTQKLIKRSVLLKGSEGEGQSKVSEEADDIYALRRSTCQRV